MKLYFQAGKKHRIAIDFNNRCYCTDYSYLGGYRSYIQISATAYESLLGQCIEAGFGCQQVT